MRNIVAITMLAAVLGTASPSAADAITLAGSTISLRNCRIQAILQGEVFYRDHRGKLYRRPIEDVRSLSLDGLPALDEAEAAIADGELEVGLGKLIQSLLVADNDLQRLWLHVRLARIHDRHQQYVPALGHAAAVWALSDDAYWRNLEPRTPPPDPSEVDYLAASEALGHLVQAQKKVQNAELARVVNRLLQMMNPLQKSAARRYRGGPIPPGSTISGVPKHKIRQGRIALKSGAAERQLEADPRAAGAPAGPKSEQDDSSLSPESIEAMLKARRFDQAVAACERVSAAPGGRSVPRLLDQFGRALKGSGHDLDAAIMFMRVAILFPTSPYAPEGLIETALIYERALEDRGTARRLLEEALANATELDRPEARRRATDELGRLNSTATGGLR